MSDPSPKYELLTVPGAAKRLGVSRTTIQKAIKAGQIRVVVVSGLRRILAAELDAWIEGTATARQG